jgi:acetyl/propionyl-CoA carboxylase alpha subunit
MKKIIEKVLIANRGVPAVRVIHTCRDLGIATTAVYSSPDRLAAHVLMADSAVHIGEAPPIQSYLNMEKMIAAARKSGSNAVHPGWGFLAENPEFAQMVLDAGLIWIGPTPEVIRAMGDKIRAKELALKANVPTIPGLSGVKDVNQIKKWMKEDDIHFPIMIKAAAGGGGRGMIKVEKTEDLEHAFEQTRSEAKKSFGDGELLVELYIERGRHIEVQVVADTHGNVIHLYERECTLQRRNQKIIEEAPSPSLNEDIRNEICFTANRLMREIGYTSAGTVEFLFDSTTSKYFFLEVNTRLQVEHGITELITGLDIVSIMIDIAQGKALSFSKTNIQPNRWALEVRLNAEDPETFAPSFGTISRLRLEPGPGVRVAQSVYEGASVPPYYDSLMMLIMSTGLNRDHAIQTMDRTLSRNIRVEGVKTLAPLLLSIIRHKSFRSGDFSTRFIEEHMDELISTFTDRNSEDEVLKIAHYIADVSALGTQPWM